MSGISGHGRDARVGPLRWNGLPGRAARFVVETDAACARDAAVRALELQGFAGGDDGFEEQVLASGSEWTARNLYLGDVTISRKRGAMTWLVEGSGLDFLVPFRRAVTPTLVIVCARACAEATELLIASHVSVRGASDSNDAAPLLRRAWDGIEERFRADGVFVSREKLWRIENDGSPASRKVVRDLLGWR
ncbi:hypothetical protein QE374_000534 [Microbacterium sp. SORGH_AS428]|uniref:hypothetical protein n=1 Tax=Microbacterium sp. SORGH_AS_0428 TaxID=3041788 RepID=UPI002865BFDB|nr:hypothetical protein [Microbacterium sp. SORGH_AS_0428]MDR6198625.1 hypothetical protein [Microbacterium sp. SORGH_AS_0428]